MKIINANPIWRQSWIRSNQSDSHRILFKKWPTKDPSAFLTRASKADNFYINGPHLEKDDLIFLMSLKQKNEVKFLFPSS